MVRKAISYVNLKVTRSMVEKLLTLILGSSCCLPVILTLPFPSMMLHTGYLKGLLIASDLYLYLPARYVFKSGFSTLA